MLLSEKNKLREEFNQDIHHLVVATNIVLYLIRLELLELDTS